MVTPSARREAARHLVERKEYSVRMACRTTDLYRSTYYYQPILKMEEKQLVKDLYKLSRNYPRYGYPRITKVLREDGWRVNKKRVQRLWRQEGLKVPRKQRKRSRLGLSTAVRQQALYPNHVWSWDFLFDRTADGRSVKILNIVDENSRFNIVLEARRHFKADDVIEVLGRALVRYGIPGCIRSDNGPEFIANKLKDWVEDNGMGIMYIAPGSPWENPYVDRVYLRWR